MRKLIIFSIFLIIFGACGPSEEEIAQQNECDRQITSINELKDFWKSKKDNILVDEEIAGAYRDEMSILEEDIWYYYRDCQEVEGHKYQTDIIFNTREKIIEDIGFNRGYWKGKLESST